jgi:biotin carboxyl carrier protein
VALSYDEIAEILKIIDGSSCDELIVDTGDVKLVVRRNSAGAHRVQDDPPAPAAPSVDAPAPPPAAAPITNLTAQPVRLKKAPHQVEIVAPMVGTDTGCAALR